MIWAEKKELDADHKTIQQIEFVEQLKNVNDINTDLAESMFVLTNLEKKLKKEIKIFSRKCNCIANNDKLSRSKNLSNKYRIKLKSAAK